MELASRLLCELLLALATLGVLPKRSPRARRSNSERALFCVVDRGRGSQS